VKTTSGEKGLSKVIKSNRMADEQKIKDLQKNQI